MKKHKAYRTELNPNDKQIAICRQSAGISRFAYNWGLQRKNEVYLMNQMPVPKIKNPTSIDLYKELIILKKSKFPWMYEVSKCCPQEALCDLDNAFKNFFEGRAKYPKFKRKRNKNSFRLAGRIKAFDDSIRLPKMGCVRLKERGYIPTNVHILSATISECAGRWFVSVAVKEDIKPPINNGPVVGVDLGIKTLATVSDGTVVLNPKALSRCERKLKRQQREVSRRKKGSNNRRKSVNELRKTHYKIANIRKDTIHKATTHLARTKSVVCIEDLNVSGMMKNHHLAQSIGDASWREFRRQLDYKTEWYGSNLVVADRFYPSSKTCSRCGHMQDMSLYKRTFECGSCGFIIDRDLNASINLKNLAVSSTESINACLSREVSGSLIQCSPVIQESDIGPGDRFV